MSFTKKHKKSAFILFFFIVFLSFTLYPLAPQKPIKYIDRESEQIKTENIYGENWLAWLYYNPIGEATLWALAKRKITSSVYGNMMDSPNSVKKIMPFVKEFNVDLSITQKQKFTSFNDFFTRKLKPEARPIDTEKNVIVSPADGKILAYSDVSQSDFYIKGYRFNISTFLENPNLTKKYQNGSMVILRLAPPDYHRFHFPIGGIASSTTKIDGQYFSVSPLALRRKAEIFCLNKREYTLIENPDLGKVAMIEVGATLVGSMIQTFKGNSVTKGEEKGYFKFGGSTVVLLFENNKINIDSDFLINSKKGLETSVKMGEEIGRISTAKEIKE